MGAKKKVNMWLGLTDERKEGRFVWVTGEKVTFTAWGEGEPNDWDGKEDYAASWGGDAWNDFPASFRAGYVCEWE